MHGGLHERELATVLAMAGGPILRSAVMRGAADLTDVAPSVLALLGLASDGMDGRALVQAWGEAGDADPAHEVLRPVEHRAGLRLFRLCAAQRPDAML